MTTMIIGRDSQTGRLKLTVDERAAVVGKKNSVPSGVGREHASLEIDEDNGMVLHNLNIENDTYVNGFGIETKRVKKGDRIELGKERYLLTWEMIDAVIPHYVDITPLEEVWNEYQEKLLQMQIRERRSNTLRSATGLITMGALALRFLTTGDNPVLPALYIIAGVVSAFFFVKAMIDSSKIPHQQQQLRDSLPKKYVCPHCGQFLGNQPYEVISQRSACPYCKAIYKV